MPEPKDRLSPIKKVKAALVRSPIKSPTTTDRLNFAASGAEKLNSRMMEDIYFTDPKSRESLSTNPGDTAKHLAERKRCTTDNWKAEIERRIVAESKMVDHAYGDQNPFRNQAYGHGDGQK
ncbi:uncharacterized protein Z520_03015 [Fonsecaea multimorphosa CBS 102226]|uniref:Uncharacterized protein n=1 Tax=Fonsecaea multimorphosa CBS 102226 TaxID=1442371 RepID=A0A0D2K6K2_9EURO|nr:uncharacterized protein Z520_03015 [Fonsecaea multimorphosa CBS 102226]KIY01463.1 hypothetical protein Z520_03015 [Fonsecaea multimorphosa CBS 102226]OAL28227.1 hypothetical protein AYO22_02933 [Fonsecaea multimorphosa]